MGLAELLSMELGFEASFRVDSPVLGSGVGVAVVCVLMSLELSGFAISFAMANTPTECVMQYVARKCSPRRGLTSIGICLRDSAYGRAGPEPGSAAPSFLIRPGSRLAVALLEALRLARAVDRARWEQALRIWEARARHCRGRACQRRPLAHATP